LAVRVRADVPPLFFILNSRFFYYRAEEVQNRKQKYFLIDYLGGVWAGTKSKTCFSRDTELRNGEFSLPPTLHLLA
jgi:hypothetical protein